MLAARACNAPSAVLILSEDDPAPLVFSLGLGPAEVDRAIEISRALGGVPDIWTADEGMEPALTSIDISGATPAEWRFRSVAGARLESGGGRLTGALLVFDTVSRSFTPDERDALRGLAQLFRSLTHAASPAASEDPTIDDPTRSEERFRAFVEQSAEGIWCFELRRPVPTSWSADRQIRAFYEVSYLAECNRAMARMYGFTEPHELIGVRLSELLPPEEQENIEYLRAFVSSGYRMTDAETAERDRNGNLRHYLNNLVGIQRDGYLTRVWGTQREITEIKNLQLQLLQAQKMEAIGLLAGSIAHDFNNLLTAIFGYTDLALSQTPGENLLHSDLLEVRKASERAAALTRQLLAFSRRQELQPRILDLNSAVEDLQRLLRRLIGERITLETIMEPNLWLVKADKGQLEQVLMNLAINARDAMPHGGHLVIRTSNVTLGEEHARTIPELRAGEHVVLSVSDDGVGMDAETKARIFEPFFTTKGCDRGTGLGMATVYGIVRQSNGHIAIRSAPGEGSTFDVILPRATGDSAPGLQAETGFHTRAPMTVLLVEDEDGVRGCVRRTLEEMGHTVLEADTMTAAVALAESAPIDLLITDVVLPEGNGRSLAEVLAPARPKMRVLFTSGYSDPDQLEIGEGDQPANFLQKPFTAEALQSALARLID